MFSTCQVPHNDHNVHSKHFRIYQIASNDAAIGKQFVWSTGFQTELVEVVVLLSAADIYQALL